MQIIKRLYLGQKGVVHLLPVLVLALLAVGLAVAVANLNGSKEVRSRAQIAGPTISIDAGTNVHAISPYIYGTAADTSAYQKTMGATISRWGGNQVTRSNWENNGSNAGIDWGPFCNVWQGSGFGLPAGRASVEAINGAKAEGMAFLLTIPTIGWVAKDQNNATCSTGVPNSGGMPLNGTDAISGYDPLANRTKTSIPSYAKKPGTFSYPPSTTDGAVYQDEWVNYLVSQFGKANTGGVRFYAMDNEYDLWPDTHRDIKPAFTGYEQLWSTFTAYADAVKAVDPTAEITAPVSWGWTNYWFSPLDRGPSGDYSNPADRQAHGNVPLLQWFLRQAKARDQQLGRRTLDVLDVHYYPQSGEYSQDTSTNMQALRMRSTRELWDPTYATESWMACCEGGPNIQVIRRLKDWINSEYPGTKLGITEWNWGADNHINGALAIADVLGVFGREDVYLANYWTTPANLSPGYWAWRMYRNYDGAFSRFGDTSVRADVPTASLNNVSAYASKDSATGELKVMLLNKLPSTTQTVALNIANYGVGSTAKVYQYNAADTTQIKQLPNITNVAQNITYTLAPYSITLLVFNSTGMPLPTSTQQPSPSSTPTIAPSPTARPTVNPTIAPTPALTPTPIPASVNIMVAPQNQTVTPNSNVTAMVHVTIPATTPVNTVELMVTYPTNLLSFVKFDDTTMPSAFSLVTQESLNSGVLTISKGSTSLLTGGQHVVGLVFQANQATGTGSITIDPNSIVVSATNHRALPISTTNGTVTVGRLGDLNQDGKVNIFDFSIFLTHWQTKDALTDFNHDGITNIFDFSIFLNNFDKS